MEDKASTASGSGSDKLAGGDAPPSPSPGQDRPIFELMAPATPPPRQGPAPTTLTGQTLASPAPARVGVVPAAASTPEVSALPRPLATPEPPRHPRLLSWLVLAACLLVGAPALLVDLGRVPVTNPQEALTLATLSDTHSRYEDQGRLHGLSAIESLLPHHLGRTVDQPPALTWLQMLAIGLRLEPVQTPHDLIVTGRRLSVAMALLTIACLVWAGHSIAGHRMALMAGLIAASNPAIIHFGRQATPAILMAAMAMLAVAAALWAIRPMRASPSIARQGLGWAVCGLALGTAAFTTGLTATLLIVLPILLMLLLCPGRISHLLGLIAAMLIAALMIVSWIAISQAHAVGVPWWWKPQALTHYWLNQDWGDFLERLAASPALVLAAMLPWSLWIPGALLQPFSSSSSGTRLKMFLGWAWFVLMGLLLVALPATTAHASLLVCVTAGVVMVGHLFTQYADLADVGRHARLWRMIRWPHLLMMTLLSVGVAGLVIFQDELIERAWLATPFIKDAGVWFGVGLGVALLGLTGLSVRWAIGNYPVRCLAIWSIWSAVLLTAVVGLWSRGPASDSAVPEAGDHLRQLVQDKPIYWLPPEAPDAATVFYSALHPVPLPSRQIDQVRKEQPEFYLLASADQPLRQKPGMRLVWTLPDGRIGLWRVTAPGTAPGSSPAPGSVPAP